VNGARTVILVPPPSFDPATATPAQLKAYGIPRRPTHASPAAQAAWQRMVEHMHFTQPPPAIIQAPDAHTDPAIPVRGRAVAPRGVLKCSKREPPLENFWRATRRHLLPRGAVRVTLCHYRDAGHQGRLMRSDTTVLRGHRRIRRLTRRIDALAPTKAVLGCPGTDLPDVLVLARYRGDHRASVAINLHGCRYVSNGHLLADARGTAGSARRLVRFVERLMRSGARHHRG
jgi:hypothetical protein